MDHAYVIKWPGSSMMRVEVYEAVKWTECSVKVRERGGVTTMRLRTDHHEVCRGPEEVKARIRAIKDSRINYLSTELAKWKAVTSVEIKQIPGEVMEAFDGRLEL